ncbi:MAG: hypothetical protein A2508_06605 [Candidatus Lambdaproteobacteria bacterium RIFOXYD12_FULL_49_8]|uniref:Toluene tolerance protein n=1 Tax=Candidatus Lambdaproteobacteria bacterium RIFOXYD2_FULL_50_16 TaxID=1817772 RepID=A0A1F6GDA0_9PROT|nr:MAG: hypothetical protein A2527_12290 [Candidatus Lambdaproteobacteria bacterium RIFOXYD2_FULL_50_16]OGG98240.1 MAG: hypothetical protein A2508_06605 [Candidatus Lambdaproteobacteria bacterium RIFOXYD12_FULL_49_8]
MKKLVSLLMVLLLVSLPVFAEETAEVKKLAKEKIDIVINLLRVEKDKKLRNKKIIEALDPIFDFEQMAKVSLGKTGWMAMNAEQQKEFNLLFVKRLQESYLEKLDLYTDEKVTVDEATEVQTQSGKARIYVTTHLISADDKKEMVYRFYKNDTHWLVYDVEIMGVSVVQTYRSQFAGILAKGSVEDLLAKLRKQGEFSVPTGSKG